MDGFVCSAVAIRSSLDIKYNFLLFKTRIYTDFFFFVGLAGLFLMALIFSSVLICVNLCQKVIFCLINFFPFNNQR